MFESKKNIGGGMFHDLLGGRSGVGRGAVAKEVAPSIRQQI